MSDSRVFVNEEIVVDRARARSLSVLSRGVSVVERTVDPRSRCWSKERRSSRHRIGRRLGLPVVVPESAVVDSRWVVGAGCGADSLSLLTGNSRLRY